MTCPFCNTDATPDENGLCPQCGRQVAQDEVQTATTPVAPLPTVYWYDSWVYLEFALFKAVIIATILSILIYFLADIESLKSVSRSFWIYTVVTISSLYFLWNFFRFFYLRFVRKYELNEKDIRLKKGFFNTKIDVMLLEGFWGLQLRQSLLQWCFGLGKVTLYSNDVTSPKHVIKNIGGFPDRFDTLITYIKRALDNSMIGTDRKIYKDPPLEPWHNSLWDFVDETICGIVITTVCCFLGYYISYCAYGLAIIIPLIYWGWLIMYIADSVIFTTYQLSRSCIIKNSGIFSKKVDVFILYHLQDCELSQNLWQRMMHNVGNITLFIKWDDNDSDTQKAITEQTSDNASDGTSDKTGSRITKKVVLHGLMNYEEKFNKLREYWLDERHQRRTI